MRCLRPLRCHHLISAAFHYVHSLLKSYFQALMRCILQIFSFIYSPKMNAKKYRLLNCCLSLRRVGQKPAKCSAAQLLIGEIVNPYPVC